MASVRFENVSISYGAKQVVKDFSLSVNDGEIMGIIGPSGCGKTTLIRALCGLIKPDKGSIYIADQLVFSDEKRVNIAPERRGIGVVFQDYAVWPHLSVWDNVCYPMKKHKVPKEEIAKPKLTRDQVCCYLYHFRTFDTNNFEHRRRFIETFINRIFLYDDKIVITFNYQNGTKTVTFAELEASGILSELAENGEPSS